MKNKTIYMFAIWGIVAHMNLRGAHQVNLEELEQQVDRFVDITTTKLPPEIAIGHIARAVLELFTVNIGSPEKPEIFFDEQALVNILEAIPSPEQTEAIWDTITPEYQEKIIKRRKMRALIYAGLAQRHATRVAHSIADIKAVTDGLTTRKDAQISAQEVIDYFKAKIKNPAEEGSVIVANALQKARKAADLNKSWLIHVACSGPTTDSNGQPLNPAQLPDNFQLIGVPDVSNRATRRYFEDWKYISDAFNNLFTQNPDPGTWPDEASKIWALQRLNYSWDQAIKEYDTVGKETICQELLRPFFMYRKAKKGHVEPSKIGEIRNETSISNQQLEAASHHLDCIKALFTQMNYLPSAWYTAAPLVTRLNLIKCLPSVTSAALKNTSVLTNVKRLSLYACDLFTVPENIFALKRLSFLGLDNNHISIIPPQLTFPAILNTFPSIKLVSMEKNPLENDPAQRTLKEALSIGLSKRHLATEGASASSKMIPFAAFTGTSMGSLAAVISYNHAVPTPAIVLTSLAAAAASYALIRRLANTEMQRHLAELGTGLEMQRLKDWKPSWMTTSFGILGTVAGSWIGQQPSLQNTGAYWPLIGAAAGSVAGSMLTQWKNQA